MLSPAELFAVRSREKSLPQRAHGQKDFLPDGSETQSEKLHLCRKEQWELLREERVERLGSLVSGVWKPQELLVELTSPAGKFWQTMGFTNQGKQCLLPEEAVYLLECGTIQLFYRNLPLSVQEAYERLLTGQTISLLQYQVYSHLKRLGYIVTRFDPSSVQSVYERQINMKSCSRLHRKRKRSSSPGLKAGVEQNVTIQPDKGEDGNSHCLDNIKSTYETIAGNHATEESCKVDDPSERTHSVEQSNHKYLLDGREEKGNCEASGKLENTLIENVSSFCWDFSNVFFPNCAPTHSYTFLPKPDLALLPENVVARELDLSQWLQKINLKKEKMSQREQEQWDWERRFKTSVNADPKVQSCSNWKEYKNLLQNRGLLIHKEKPPHLWASTVNPLLMPENGKTTASVLEQITVMSPSHLIDHFERQQNYATNVYHIDFDVYQADGTSEFRKSRPGRPYARICVRSFDEQIPSLRTMKHLTMKSGDAPVVFALVDCGEVAFYSFKDFKLPVDVYP
ncbi:tRNA-splicing endonuclease subunit Sen54 [Spea bombifrons]|uniref:tRNA-splicing endonuclease subunit Sen54 n=1 Tax=Spea bombifrons TaxID=233779 RepID=UPI00234B268B|nr:tRNA-splicing endonuclease subunit Sen54 [Spea bombifrons]